jgi:hypothetical protein
MIKPRNRTRQSVPIQERLRNRAAQTRAAASALPEGAEKERMLLRAHETELAANMDRWLSTSDAKRC